MEIFEFFYRLKGFYGERLFEHLKGWDDSLMDYANNHFPVIFIVMMFITVVVFLFYYYFLNHPRFNRWWHWLIALGISGFFSLLCGYFTVMSDVWSGNIAPSLIDGIGPVNAMMFGIYNFVLSVLFFFLFSLLFRRWSRNCKHSPWKLIIGR